MKLSKLSGCIVVVALFYVLLPLVPASAEQATTNLRVANTTERVTVPLSSSPVLPEGIQRLVDQQNADGPQATSTLIASGRHWRFTCGLPGGTCTLYFTVVATRMIGRNGWWIVGAAALCPSWCRFILAPFAGFLVGVAQYAYENYSPDRCLKVKFNTWPWLFVKSIGTSRHDYVHCKHRDAR